MSYGRSAPIVVAACFVGAVTLAAAGLASTGSSAARSAGRPDPDKVCTPQQARDTLGSYVAKLQADGYRLTAVGKTLLAKTANLPGSANPDPAFDVKTGQVMLAERSSAYRVTQSARRAAGSTWVPFYCAFGQQANVTFTTGVGPSYVTWYRSGPVPIQDSVRGPTLNCAKGQCVFYAFHDPPSTRAVDFAFVTAFTGPTISFHYCGGG